MVILRQIVGNAALFAGIITLVGLILQRKSVADILKGAIKATVGILLLWGGVTLLVEALSPLGKAIMDTYGVVGLMASNEIIIGPILQRWGFELPLVVVLGFIINLLLARFTHKKCIFLVGHFYLYIAGSFLVFLYYAFNLQGWALIVIGAVITGLYYWIVPAWGDKYISKVVGEEAGFTLGNAVPTCIIAAEVAKLVGDPEQSSERIRLPGWLSIFADPIAGQGIVMLIVYLLVFLVAGARLGIEEVVSILGEGNWIINLLLVSLKFTAGIQVVFLGVRTFLAQIVPAFKGLADLVAPGGIPALDVPAIFPYGPPTAGMLGFIGCLIGTMAVTLATISLGFSVIVLITILTVWFGGFGTGIVGDKFGGWKGALIGSIVAGAATCLGAVLVSLIIPLYVEAGSTFSYMDNPLMAVLAYVLHWIGMIFR